MARRRFSGYGNVYVRSCVGVNRAVKPKDWKRRMAALRAIFEKYGSPKKTSESCFLVEGLDEASGDRMKKDLKAGGFYVCKVKYKGEG